MTDFPKILVPVNNATMDTKIFKLGKNADKPPNFWNLNRAILLNMDLIHTDVY
jgi:hypothetical protein